MSVFTRLLLHLQTTSHCGAIEATIVQLKAEAESKNGDKVDEEKTVDLLKSSTVIV